MITVIFEVYPKDGHKQEYLDLAAYLRPFLSSMTSMDSSPSSVSRVCPNLEKSSRFPSGVTRRL